MRYTTINFDAVTDHLTLATSVRYLMEWEGVPQAQLDNYLSHVKQIADTVQQIDPSQIPGPDDLIDLYGKCLSTYAVLTMRDVATYLTQGKIPMTPLCDSGL